MRALVLSPAYVDPALRGKLRALSGLGCTVAALVPDHWDDGSAGPGRAQWEEDSGVQILPVPVTGDAGDPGGRRWSRRAVRRAFRDFRPDIVQVEEEPWTRAAARAVAEARRLRVPAVGFTSETVAQPLSLRLALRKRRVLKGLCGVVVVNPIADSLLALARPELPRLVAPAAGIHPPVAPAGGSGRGFVIGFAGRLIPEKGLDVLLRAVVKLIGPWSLVVSGTGPAQEELEALAERLGIAARVTWLGAQPREDRERLWPDLDCFVSPSRSTRSWAETHGPSVMAAMGHGIAVVVTGSGALASTVGDGGVVVPEGDVGALTDALQGLMDDPAWRSAIAAAGRRRAIEQFSDEALARRTLEFWRSLTV